MNEEISYRVFKRKPWTRTAGVFVPNPNARKVTVQRGLTRDEARRLCASGEANQALAAGYEYRHLPFLEFEPQ